MSAQQEEAWTQEQLQAHIHQHILHLAQHPEVAALAAKKGVSQEEVVRAVAHFMCEYDWQLAQGRMHSCDGDSFVKLEMVPVLAAIWAGMQPGAPAALHVFAYTLLHRAVLTERMGYTWEWQHMYANVGITRCHFSGFSCGFVCIAELPQ
jgi:hypothetical protein